MAQQEMNAVLVADLGNVHTRVVLIDLVEGQYRLVASARARSTAQAPHSRAALSLERAAAELEQITGRILLNPGSPAIFTVNDGEDDGIDAFLATSSAGRPMRVFLAGLTPELSLASARRALSGTYVTIIDTLTPDDPRSEEAQINALVNSDADLIMIAGGTDDGSTALVRQMLHTVETALALAQDDRRPSVLFAGNHALRRDVKTQLEPFASVFTTKNVRPGLDDEQLFAAQIELAFAYDEYRARHPGGFAEVGRVSAVGVVPTTQGYISAVRYMADVQAPAPGPLCLDIGSATSVIAAGVAGEPRYSIRTDLGVGHNAESALAAVTPERVRRWLPFEISDDALWDYVTNKQLRPATIPGTTEDLQIEQALAREIVRLLLADARPTWDMGQSLLLPPFAPIIAAGAVLTEAPHPGIAALILLDALQPTGIVDMRLDPHNLVSSLGVVAYLRPVMTVQALEAGGLATLGPAFCPLGRVRSGRKAMTVRITTSDRKRIDHVVRGGEIWMAPLLPGERAEVRVALARGLSIDGKRRLKRQVVAGAAGLVFDARGRPLELPRERDRATRFTAWQMAMMGRERRSAPSTVDVAPPEGERHAVLS